MPSIAQNFKLNGRAYRKSPKKGFISLKKLNS